MLNSIGGRKFILAMTIVLLTCVMTAFGKVDQNIYQVVMLAVIGAYLTANVVQKRGSAPAQT